VVRRGAIALLALASGACELLVDIPQPYDPDQTSDAAPRACTASTECAPPLPVCDLATGTCVECLVGAECTDPARPACGADHTCRPCTDDTECGSEVCLLDGTCADAGRILYATPTGTGPACTAADPCTADVAITLVDATRDIVKLRPGAYVRTATLQIAVPTILAATGAIFEAQLPTTFEPLLAAGADLVVIGLHTQSAGNGTGVNCFGGTTLALHRVTLSGGLWGMSLSCALVADALTITGMTYYAMSVSQAPITMTNSMIVRNGGMSIIGGIYLNQVPSGTIEHTTIADNQKTENMGAEHGGLSCVESPNVVIASTILWGNEAPSIDPACNVRHSVVDPGYPLGPDNVSMDPQFVSAATGDYHLMPASPVRGIASPTSVVDHDFDREPRPQPAGTIADPGADEIP
jgi:hypothetical protein